MTATRPTKHELNGRIHTLTRKQARELLDRRARHYLRMSGDEFIRAWDAGRFDDAPDRPEVMRVAMLLPIGR